MATITTPYDSNDDLRGIAEASRGQKSAVSWPAIFAGAAASAALSLILLVLGTGLGLAVVSPWSDKGIASGTLAMSTIVWIVFSALVTSGLGGYIAGRLRVKWQAVHTDEVYFRDTAHGFLAWAVATLVTAALLTSTIGTIMSLGAVGGTVAAAAGSGASIAGATPGTASGMSRPGADGIMQSMYTMDSLFRVSAPINQAAGVAPNPGTQPGGEPSAPMMATKAEVGRMFANSMRTGALPPDDVRYAGQLVSQRTGLTQQDAEKRVTDAYASAKAKFSDAEAKAKEVADQTRKDAEWASLWMFVSLLTGAFSASLMATIGGRRRDRF
jgi:hypothetical protein